MDLNELIESIPPDAVIIGVGNDISGDDAFGPVIQAVIGGAFE
jgi:Ni,Fe-hydrogenase maturation factor